MRHARMKCLVFVFLSMMQFSRCVPIVSHVVSPEVDTGLFTAMDSTAPPLGPLTVGMTRSDIERHLGDPVTTQPLVKGRYRALYLYERERGILDRVTAETLDTLTFGLGCDILPPLDRFNGTWHLMAVTYDRIDKHETRDRVVLIEDRPEAAPPVEGEGE